MRHLVCTVSVAIPAAMSLAAVSPAVHAETLDWQGILQRGVSEVIRSMDAPTQAPSAPTRKPAPVYKPATPPSSAPSLNSQSTRTPDAQAPQKAAKPQVSASTVDARIADNLGDPAQFRRFFDRLKKEVAAGRRTALAKMMNYPLAVSGSKIKVFSDKDFLANYDSIFTPSVVAAVKNQPYETLFVRDTGASVGNGQLWFSGACVDSSCAMRVPKVVAVNPPEEEMAAAPPTTAARTSAPGSTVLAGADLPQVAAPGSIGLCRQLPAQPSSGSLTISGELPHENTHCYRLSGRSGQSVHIELKSVNTGFSIDGFADNRYDLKFKSKNQPYDIVLAQTFPGPGADHYELRITFR